VTTETLRLVQVVIRGTGTVGSQLGPDIPSVEYETVAAYSLL
jgi:hypothetical protein